MWEREGELSGGTHVLYLLGVKEGHHLPDAVFADRGLRGFAQVLSLLLKFSPRL